VFTHTIYPNIDSRKVLDEIRIGPTLNSVMMGTDLLR
jgi:hypothetical protein